MVKQKREWRGPKFSIGLQVTEPVKTADGWEANLIAPVVFKPTYSAPDPPKEVVFKVNGYDHDQVITDEESGQAFSGIVFDQFGSYLITAHLRDMPAIRVMSRVTIRPEEKKPPKPAKLNCYEGGQGNDRNLTFEVLTAEGTPVAGAIVRIIDSEITGTGFEDLPLTNERGVTAYKFSLQGKEKIIRVSVLGTPIETWKNFFRV